MATLAAAAVFAFDQRVADDDAAADAGAERQQHQAVILGAGAAPELAVGGRVGVVGKRDRHAEVMAHAIANRKIPPAGQIAGPQESCPWRMSIGPGVARPARTTSLAATPASAIKLREQLANPPAGVFGALVLLGGHRVIRQRLAVVSTKPDLDIRAADIDADEVRLLAAAAPDRR